MAHYHEYRATRALDAWWTNEATREDKQRVIAVIEVALAEFGPTRKRAWGSEDDDLERAKLAVRTHLARIEAARPLDAVDERSAALCAWFKQGVLDGMD